MKKKSEKSHVAAGSALGVTSDPWLFLYFIFFFGCVASRHGGSVPDAKQRKPSMIVLERMLLMCFTASICYALPRPVHGGPVHTRLKGGK